MPGRSLTCSRIVSNAMQYASAWLHRLPEVLEVLRGFDTDDILRASRGRKVF